MTNAYSAEIKLSTQQKVYIDSFYRKHKRTILNILSLKDNVQMNGYDISGVIDAGKSASVVGSLIHMHINRLFANNQRLYELMVYALLRKAYETLSHLPK